DTIIGGGNAIVSDDAIGRRWIRLNRGGRLRRRGRTTGTTRHSAKRALAVLVIALSKRAARGLPVIGHAAMIAQATFSRYCGRYCGAAKPTPPAAPAGWHAQARSEEHTSELQSRENLVCRLLLEKKKKTRVQ